MWWLDPKTPLATDLPPTESRLPAAEINSAQPAGAEADESTAGSVPEPRQPPKTGCSLTADTGSAPAQVSPPSSACESESRSGQQNESPGQGAPATSPASPRQDIAAKKRTEKYKQLHREVSRRLHDAHREHACEIRRLQVTVDALEELVVEQQLELQDVRAAKTRQAIELQQEHAKTMTLQQDLQRAEQKLDTAQARIASQRQQIADLEQRFSTACQQTKEQTERAAQAEARHKIQEHRLDSDQAQMRVLQQCIVDRDGQLSAAFAEVQAKAQQLSESESRHAEELSEHQAQTAKLEIKWSQRLQQNSELHQEQARRLQHELVASRDEIEHKTCELQAVQRAWDSERAEATRGFTALQDQYRDALERAVVNDDRCTHHLQALTQVVIQQDHSLARAHAELQRLRGDRDSFEKRWKMAVVGENSISAQLRHTQAERERLASQLDGSQATVYRLVAALLQYEDLFQQQKRINRKRTDLLNRCHARDVAHQIASSQKACAEQVRQQHYRLRNACTKKSRASAKICWLKLELANTQEALHHARREAASTSRTCANQQRQLVAVGLEYAEHLQGLSSRLTELLTQNQDLQSKLARAEADREQCLAAMRRIEGEAKETFNQITAENVRLTAKCRRLNSDLQQVRRESDCRTSEARLQQAALETSLRNLENDYGSELESLDSTIVQLKQRLANEQSSRQQLTGRLGELEQRIDRERRSSAETIGRLENDKQGLEANLTDLQKLHQEQAERESWLSRKLKEAQHVQTALIEERSRLTACLLELQAHHAAETRQANRRIKSLKRTFQQHAVEYESQMQIRERDRSALSERLHQSQQFHETQARELSQARARQQKQDRDLATLRARLTAAEQRSEQQRQAQIDLQLEFDGDRTCWERQLRSVLDAQLSLEATCMRLRARRREEQEQLQLAEQRSEQLWQAQVDLQSEFDGDRTHWERQLGNALDSQLSLEAAGMRLRARRLEEYGRLQSAVQGKRAAEQEAKSTSSELATVKHRLEHAVQANRTADQELDQLRTKVVQLNDRLQQYTSKLLQAEEQQARIVAQLNEKITTQIRASRLKSDHIERLRLDNRKLSQQLTTEQVARNSLAVQVTERDAIISDFSKKVTRLESLLLRQAAGRRKAEAHLSRTLSAAAADGSEQSGELLALIRSKLAAEQRVERLSNELASTRLLLEKVRRQSARNIRRMQQANEELQSELARLRRTPTPRKAG